VFEDKLFEEMLWSDPRPIVGRQTSMRGAGVEFGQDVTFDFLRTNQLALVVRSHECVNEGQTGAHSLAHSLLSLNEAHRCIHISYTNRESGCVVTEYGPL
jgi:diadenosine tetraphosphatase ApaH/serine/threonine PP2A family protein phosphatase